MFMIYKHPEFLSHPIITPMGPAVIAVILAYVISSIFIHVFIITIDTVMLCYCEDIREHGTDADALEGKIGSKKHKELQDKVAQEGEEEKE